MEAKGLFAGAQNVTVTEVNLNNVAGAYHDYRSSGGGRHHRRLNGGHTTSYNSLCRPLPSPPPAIPLPSTPTNALPAANGITSKQGAPHRTPNGSSNPPARLTPGRPRSPVSTGMGSSHIETLNYVERNTYQRDDRYRQSLDHLVDNIAVGAIHDSAERSDAPKCHPATRRAVQEDILGWIRRGDSDPNPRKVLYISGPAGAGKTAIAGTVSDICQKDGSLAATFYFSASSGSPDRQSKRLLVSTLAYQLIQHKSIDRLKEEVLTAIHEDPVVFKKRLDQQLKALILDPLRKIAGRSDPKTWPKVILIDAVDECDADLDKVKSRKDARRAREDTHREILSVVEEAVKDPSFPFRIIVVSRPEPAIHTFFATTIAGTTFKLFLDDKYNPDADIALFFQAKFAEIRRRYNLPADWVSRDAIMMLVGQASGQFIYASTVIRFIEGTACHPQEQLKRILEWRHLDDSEPFAILDALYMGILQTSPNPHLAVKWLSVIHLLRESHRTGDHLIKAFLETTPGETEYLLGDMTSLLGLSDGQGQTRFHFYHKSLLDFLGDPKRSARLHVSVQSRRWFLEDRWYLILKHRGPQVVSPNAPYSSQDFLDQCFHRWYSKLLDTSRDFAKSDAEWWLSSKQQTSQDCREMFVHVHANCPSWYKCLPACKIWRREIIRHCKAKSWTVPGSRELLRDRFRKYDITTLPLLAPLRRR
ncbi:hypothetical protein FA13DRAFT_856843 [Coprinellus micaceus]|uniref:Nephrocystin 3-like N-terminal domain-containing protein n=1 Tax=Coprinellus micaceus TaxID=71717 RepID=A0A4Y7T2L2_COPMI|nr:hypothetical protein FA13DRAFT_856843 [Coprinellus micaceus]